jgi:hypothetical protein
MSVSNCVALATSLSHLLQQCWYASKFYSYQEGNGWKHTTLDTITGFPQHIQQVLAYRKTDANFDLLCQLQDNRFLYCKVRSNSAFVPNYLRIYVASSTTPLREQVMSASTRHQMMSLNQ